MNRTADVLKALILMVVSCTVVAPQTQSDSNAQDKPQTGTLSGRVVNESGQPLANAFVSVRAFGLGSRAGSTMTDAEGNFQITGLRPSAYIVSAYLPTYVPAPRDPDVNPISYYRLGDAVRIEMIKGGVITGTLTRANGEPIVAIPVRAQMLRDSKGQPSRYGTPAREQPTDDRGVYRIYGLPPGTYVVAAAGGTSFGYAVNPFDKEVPTYAPSSTRDTAAEVVVSAGVETANVDIRYRGEPGRTVSGIANIPITTDQTNGLEVSLSQTFNGLSQQLSSVYMDSNSRSFAFYGVADGDYDLTAQSYLSSGEWAMSAPKRIKVRGADIAGIELIAKPLGSVSGSILLEESKVPECQGKRRPAFAETVVGAWHNEKVVGKDQPQFIWSVGGQSLPDDGGNFTLRNLAPGQYRFNARQMAKYWFLKSISWPDSTGTTTRSPGNRPADAARSWTTISSGERLSGLIVRMAAGAGSIAGQIDLSDGQKLPARLFAYLVPGETDKANDILRYFGSAVSGDGAFTMNNLPPGRYWAIARVATESEPNILPKLRLPDETDWRAKLLSDAQAGKVEIEIKPCQNVTGFHLPFK